MGNGRRSRRASSSSCEQAGRCAFCSTAATCSAGVCRGRALLGGGPPGARGCDVAAFEARVASLLAARRRSTRRAELIAVVSLGVVQPPRLLTGTHSGDGCVSSRARALLARLAVGPQSFAVRDARRRARVERRKQRPRASSGPRGDRQLRRRRPDRWPSGDTLSPRA